MTMVVEGAVEAVHDDNYHDAGLAEEHYPFEGVEPYAYYHSSIQKFEKVEQKNVDYSYCHSNVERLMTVGE